MSETLVANLQRKLGAELVQTHISWVLLAGADAWKIKKPVRLGFLDFGTLEARQRMCEAELSLNRRLAPTLYLEVVPITGTTDAPELGGHGAVIEYALHMRRFAAGSLLGERLAAERLVPADIDALALRIAAFHHDAPMAAADLPYGTPERITSDTERMFAGLAARGAGARAEALREWMRAQARHLHAAFQQRRAQGWVREGHGDLHLDNTLVLDGAVTAFDCIEFDPGLRWIDVQADIAFFVMDLLAHERAGWAFRFLDGYLAESGDYAGCAVLRYYLVYRACVRALVARLRAPAAAAPDYLGLAQRLTQPAPPRLLITHGVSGSGKSHAAAQLLEQTGAIRVRSDVERKRLFGLRPLADSAREVAGGIYGAEATARTYARLAELAENTLQAGWPVIVDAAFLRAGERAAFRDLAARAGVPFTILHCEAPRALLEQRVRARQQRADDPSEADAAVLGQQSQFQETLSADESARALVFDSSQALDAKNLAARWLGRA